MRRRLGWFLAGLLALMPTTSAYAQVTWWEDERDFVGHLAWKQGAGSIVWSQEYETEPFGPTATETQRAHMEVRRNLDAYTAPPGFQYPGPEEFLGRPLPQDLHLNVSRPILLILRVQSAGNSQICAEANYAPDPFFRVELWADGQRLAGAHGGDFIRWSSTPFRTRPADLPNTGTCRFAMSPEMAYLPAGTSLRLRVVHLYQTRDYPLAFGDEHPSQLRFPVYDGNELLYRHPELFEDADPLAGTLGGLVLPVLGAAGLTLPRLARRRAGPGLAFLLVASVALSGCAGTSNPASTATANDGPAGRIESSYLANPDAEKDPGRGAILGRVFDDQHVALGGVHISLLGTPSFAVSDGLGRFRFPSVAAGDHTMRFSLGGYRVFEAPVSVSAGVVTRVDVQLFPLDPKARDALPHVHNYWIGVGDRKIVADRNLPLYCAFRCFVQGTFYLEPKQDDPNTVLPGTARMELNLTWDIAAARFARLGLVVRNNAHAFNDSVYLPRGPGELFRIPVSWESADVGHQKFSTWEFRYGPAPEESRAYLDAQIRTNDPAYAPTPVHAKIEIVRGGALPLEPGHKDFWKGAVRVNVLKRAYTETPAGTLYPPRVGLYNRPEMLFGSANLVPPETEWLSVTLEEERALAFPFDWRLQVKPANVPEATSDPETGAGYRDVGIGQRSGSVVTWRVPVAIGEGDPYYGKISSWKFLLFADESDEMNYYLESWLNAQTAKRLRIKLDVDAHRAA